MALLLNNGLVYMHIPKTGGNWLTDLLDRSGLVAGAHGHKHATYEALVGTGLDKAGQAAGTGITGYFCVVRDPISWYESWYKYQCHRDWRQWGVAGDISRWHVMAGMNACVAPDFNEFMMQVNRQAPGFAGHLFSRYTLGSGAHILRTETLREDFFRMCRETGLNIREQDVFDAPRLGVSPPRETLWNPAVLKLTVENESAAMRLYGYDTGQYRVQAD